MNWDREEVAVANLFQCMPEVRDLEDEPLNPEEVEMMAEGYPPSTLGGLDAEEVIRHLASRLLDLQEEYDGMRSHCFGEDE